MKSKKAMELEVVAYYIVAFAILVLLVIAIIYLSRNGKANIQYIKDLFRFK